MKICCLQTLLLSFGAQLLLSGGALTAPTTPNNFFYQEFLSGNRNKEIHFSGVKLHVDSAQPSVFAVRGGNATMPCRFWYEPELSSPREVRIKWSWLPAAGGHETDVLVAVGSRGRSFGEFSGRVQLRQDFPGDTALVMTGLRLNDTGRYRCEVVDGLEDKSSSVHLELQGVVFPYQHPRGQYHLSFLGAQQACEEQDSTLATFTQLFQSWKEGLNWCNAGWLADGTVQYPITRSRAPCGGHGLAPGVRSYGRRHRHLHHYDVFCFSSSLRGEAAVDTESPDFVPSLFAYSRESRCMDAPKTMDRFNGKRKLPEAEAIGTSSVADASSSLTAAQGSSTVETDSQPPDCKEELCAGKVYYLQPSHMMNLTEAQQACQEDGAEIAKVGQLYAAWKFMELDCCDAGWLADGSVRYPITRPRTNCGSSEPGVRSFGFPPPQHKHGVYCYKSDDEGMEILL